MLASLGAEKTHFMRLGCYLGLSTSAFLTVQLYGIDTCPIGMAVPENIGIAVGIALLACLRDVINAFRGCRPPSWIFHFRFLSSLVVCYRYMSHWYGWPKKHRYDRLNPVAIKYGNEDNRFALFTSGSRPPSWIFHFHSFEKVFRRTWLSSGSLNLIKMSHGW